LLDIPETFRDVAQHLTVSRGFAKPFCKTTTTQHRNRTTTQQKLLRHRDFSHFPLESSTAMCSFLLTADEERRFSLERVQTVAKASAMYFLCAVYNQSLRGVDWPEGENDPDGKFADMQHRLQFAMGELISRLEPEDAFKLAVYRDVLNDCEDYPLDDDDEQERLVNCMEAVIAATKRSLRRASGSLNETGPLKSRAPSRVQSTTGVSTARERAILLGT
jgi:hypothetical protein